MKTATLNLPGGYFYENTRYREVELAPVTGKDLESLSESSGEKGQALSTAAAVTILLKGCLKRVGPITHITPDLVRNLTVGDRDFLMLSLRQLTSGNRIEAILVCPQSSCGEKIDIDFKTGDIPVKKGDMPTPYFSLTLPQNEVYRDKHGNNHTQLNYRLPNGADQEALASLFARDPAQAVAGLLRRCVHSSGHPSKIDELVLDNLSPKIRDAIDQAMEERAPALDMEMESRCPQCGHQFPFPFNIAQFFIQELNGNLDQLYREVHSLAFYYKWSEQDILSMTQSKRRKYLELLSEHFESNPLD